MTTTTAGTASSTVQALSGSELERLIVLPPAPFAQTPYSELGTGLMEVGNPASGTIGIGFAKQDEIVRAGFQRGWEKIFRTPDRAVVDINLFEFRAADGPSKLVALFQSREPSGSRRLDVPGVPGAPAVSGTSPEGNVFFSTAFGHGRFLVTMEVGGRPGAHDYQALFENLATGQLAKLQALDQH